jgi:tetratricopeptide (TPR) repeat protein
VRTTPRDVDARLRLAELYARAHDLDHSISAYRDLLALDPANLRGTMGLARVLRWSHRYADAEQLYKEALAAAPDDGDAIEGLAQTYALADHPGPGLLDRGSRSRHEDTDLLALKGTCCWQGRSTRARLDRAGAGAQPALGRHRAGLGDILMWKRLRRAAQAYHRALGRLRSVPTALDLAAAIKRPARRPAENVIKGRCGTRRTTTRPRAPAGAPAWAPWDASRPWRIAWRRPTRGAAALGLRVLGAAVSFGRRAPLSTDYQALSATARLAWVIAFVTEVETGSLCRWTRQSPSSCRWRSPCPRATGRPPSCQR